MKEETFGEQFPSLRNKQKVISFNIEEHNGHKWIEGFDYLSKEVVSVEEIKENCLDKQSVLDAIDDMSCCQAPNVCQCCEQLEDLKEQLSPSKTKGAGCE